MLHFWLKVDVFHSHCFLKTVAWRTIHLECSVVVAAVDICR